ncbi:MAG: flagellin FliC [Nitrospinae bacterium]|nr:flagellin FliC [Nitrospinota bacterium]
MPISINNSFTTSAQRNIASSGSRLADSLSKLASGKRINKAADDAAGLAIAEQLNADIASAEQAQRNISDGMSMTRVAEGALGEVSDMLTRGRELAVQAASGTLNSEQRALLNNEISAIKSEIDRVAGTTEFNGQKLLSGELAPGAATQVNVQAGINSTPADQINLNVVDQADTGALGVSGVDISTQQGARDALAAFDTAIQNVTESRANIGSLQNRFDSAASNLGVYKENLVAANSNISDLDYAQGVSDMNRNNVLNQAATSALKQGTKIQAGAIGSLLNIKG